VGPDFRERGMHTRTVGHKGVKENDVTRVGLQRDPWGDIVKSATTQQVGAHAGRGGNHL